MVRAIARDGKWIEVECYHLPHHEQLRPVLHWALEFGQMQRDAGIVQSLLDDFQTFQYASSRDRVVDAIFHAAIRLSTQGLF